MAVEHNAIEIKSKTKFSWKPEGSRQQRYEEINKRKVLKLVTMI